METYKRCIGKYADGTRCNCIGTHRYISAASGGKERCLCDFHFAEMQSYSTENSTKRGTANKMNDIRRRQTFSVELETMRPTATARGQLAEKDFVATSDCTVDVEFKSPIWETGKSAIATMTKTVDLLKRNGDITIDSHCGTHFHVGLKDDNGGIKGMTAYMDYIRRFYHSLIVPFSDFIMAQPDKGAQVFGRPLGGEWAQPVNMQTPSMEHRNFINVQHEYSLEFRQMFFVNGAQYARAMRLCRRCAEFAIEWAQNFTEYGNAETRRAEARKVSAKMIAEYQKAVAAGYDYDKGK